MKFYEWSVVRTADKKGVSLKPLTTKPADVPEVCVAVRDGVLEINVHKDGVDEPVTRLKLPAKGD
jgi:hypothetical protein